MHSTTFRSYIPVSCHCRSFDPGGVALYRGLIAKSESFTLCRGRVNRDFKIIGDGWLRRLNECHATFHSSQMSPSELWDGVFSRGFSSW